MVVRPSPFQSPTTGSQPRAPKRKRPASAEPKLFSFRRYQVAVVGSKIPIVVMPSPFQSPATGIQPGAPKTKMGIVGTPALFRSRRYQVAERGSTTPMVD